MLQTGIKAGFDPEMQRINRKHCLTNKNNQVTGEDELNIEDSQAASVDVAGMCARLVVMGWVDAHL